MKVCGELEETDGHGACAVQLEPVFLTCLIQQLTPLGYMSSPVVDGRGGGSGVC
jgi:hypothetical protein